MDSYYTNLLGNTKLPQSSLQKLAVISIFDKFRSGPPSSAGQDAISRCLRSPSPFVVDQSTRELCRLVKDSKFDILTGLMELHSALENSSEPQVSSVFIKGIGLLTRLGFVENPCSFRFYSSEMHPFVKILCCGAEVQSELLKQVFLFLMKCKQLGMEVVCEFLGPFINYSIIKFHVSGSSSAFVRNLVSTMAAFCCSFPQEAIPIIKLLTESLNYFSSKNAEEVTNVSFIVECVVDAYLVVLKQLVAMGQLVDEAQLCGLVLLEAILSQHKGYCKCSGGVEKILDVSKHILSVHKELGLHYVTELSSVILSLFHPLILSELEDEQYSILKLLLFLLRWKNEEHPSDAALSQLHEESLFIFPVLALVSSPSRRLKQTAIDVLSILGNIAFNSLAAPQEKLVGGGMQPSIVTPGHISFKCLRNLWFEDRSLLLGLAFVKSTSESSVYIDENHSQIKSWISYGREYFMGIDGKHRHASNVSESKIDCPTEMPLVLCAISGVMFLHQKGNSTIDMLAFCSIVEPGLGVPVLLIILFYNHLFSNKRTNNDFHGMLLKLLRLLPSLASQTAMTPLVLQILLPLLHKDVTPVVKATAIRLICKTWEVNDRIFGSLQGVLSPNALAQAAHERVMCISIAASIQDVCRKDPDKGVDIILSVAACIENSDPLVQSLGFQSLAHLCEADVVDFYTAWDVISKNANTYLENASVAHGLSHFLKWGAMDADAYPEAAANVLNILWGIGTYKDVSQSFLWRRAQKAAFSALLQYEVVQVQRTIPDFSNSNLALLNSMDSPELMTAVEEFEIKIINYEHSIRRRYVKQRRGPTRSKIVKLLDVVPEVIFSSGGNHKIREVPGAALLCFPTQKDLKNRASSKRLQDVHDMYEDAALEISASLKISRNIVLALLSLQSWKPFMQRWMRSCTMALEGDTKAHPTTLDKTLKAANDILKVVTRLAETAIPQSAENIALSLGAFCLVLPASAHTVKSMASKFLLNWMSQYEHECRQWSAAFSVGLISSCLHTTDHKQKFENISALIKVASFSKSTLVKGACGIGLGFACQSLLTRFDSEATTESGKENYKMLETELLGKILRTLVLMICQFNGSAAGVLEKLAGYFPPGTDEVTAPEMAEFLYKDIDQFGVDAWGISGPIIGLGNSLAAVYRAGAHDAVHYFKSLIISWIPGSPTFSNSSLNENPLQMSSLGACLALPSIVSFCQRVELIDDTELDHLLSSFISLISALSHEQSDTFHQSLLMASCAGAGSLLSVVSNAKLHTFEAEHIKRLVELFRRNYLSSNPPLVHLGGMLGVVNALGAGAGTLIQQISFSSHATYDQKVCQESSYVESQLLEAETTSLVQEIFLIAQSSEDPQLQQYAAWSISFLRNFGLSKQRLKEEIVVQDDSSILTSATEGFSEDSLVMKLSTWLMQINYPELGTRINTLTVAFALRCLSRAPRLPVLDWGSVIRRCMKYGALQKGTLREECFLFSSTHANQSDSLLAFVDELSDISRLKTLEIDLQSLVLMHLADLLKIFSNSRIVKLFNDVADFLHCAAVSDQYNQAQKISLQVSCWKGLQICLNDSALETLDYAWNLEHCMEVLFTMLPWFQSDITEESRGNLEWREAIQCLGKARQSFVLDLLRVSDANIKEVNHQSIDILKIFKAKAALVQIGSMPLSELSKLRAYILGTNPEVIWNVLVDVTVTLQHSDESVRRQWLVATAEILCVTRYPSTALRFLGLLCGSGSKYMPILIADKFNVLSDLPITLSSLVLSKEWETVAESVASYLMKSTERVHNWVKHIKLGDYLPESQLIDQTENDVAVLLFNVLRQICVSLKEYLPAEELLRLANMGEYRN